MALMPRIATRADVQRLLLEGAQLVEVLPAADYAQGHLALAQNLPLKELDEGSASRLDRARPVVVYCNDTV